MYEALLNRFFFFQNGKEQFWPTLPSEIKPLGRSLRILSKSQRKSPSGFSLPEAWFFWGICYLICSQGKLGKRMRCIERYKGLSLPQTCAASTFLLFSSFSFPLSPFSHSSSLPPFLQFSLKMLSYCLQFSSLSPLLLFSLPTRLGLNF